MNVLTAVLPSLREIRTPLVSGYIWLTAGWLVFGESLPNRETNVTYAQLWVLIDAVGPLGAAIAVSMAAYLFGSLVQSAVQYVRAKSISYLYSRRSLNTWRSVRMSRERREPLSGDWIPVADLAPLVTEEEVPQQRFGLGFLLPATRLESMFDHVIARALEDSRRRITDSIRRVVAAHGDRARVRYLRDGSRSLVEVPQGQGLVPCLLPEVSPGPMIVTGDRLATVSQRSWQRMEQLVAEAEFREGVALPLFVLIFVLAVQVGGGWLAALVVPIALLAQRHSFVRRNAWETVFALQAVVGTRDLDRITPVFARCRAETEALIEALDNASWSEAPAS